MYFNDVHILYYVIAILVGGALGQLIDYASKMFIDEKKIFSRVSFSFYMKTTMPNYLLIFAMAVIYAALIYLLGEPKNMLETIDLAKYIIMIPLLLCAFIVDLKIQIIPNRLNLLLFELGVITAFMYGFVNISLTIKMLIGMLVGGGIFLLITLVGGAIAGKEAMGLRRC